jgi:hypothetical protein
LLLTSLRFSVGVLQTNPATDRRADRQLAFHILSFRSLGAEGKRRLRRRLRGRWPRRPTLPRSRDMRRGPRSNTPASPLERGGGRSHPARRLPLRRHVQREGRAWTLCFQQNTADVGRVEQSGATWGQSGAAWGSVGQRGAAWGRVGQS